MPQTRNRAVLTWILAFGSFGMLLVIYGGFVRLTRSGLSIVEWNPVSGAVPPLNKTAWQTEFAKYQLTPEYRQINFDMTLQQYEQIFIVEWIHRILARFAGLVFAIPFFVFVLKGYIPPKEIGLYVVMGILFLAQAVLGWIMVSSGLVDRPSVSQYLLTAHLFLALTLIGISLWTALGHLYGFPDRARHAKWSVRTRAVFVGLVLLLVQIAYGGFTAGLKAGHVSDTWPLMLGRLIPLGLLGQIKPAALNLVDAPLTVAFIHRWMAFAVLIAASVIFSLVRSSKLSSGPARALVVVLILGMLQIALGVTVVISQVQIAAALLHQANAIALFCATVYLLHRLRSLDQKTMPLGQA